MLHIAGNFTAIVIWSLSTLVHDMTWRYVMWFSSIILEIIVLVVFSRRSSVTFAGSHLPERFALFTIIVLGEVTKKTPSRKKIQKKLRHLGLFVFDIISVLTFRFLSHFEHNRMSLESLD